MGLENATEAERARLDWQAMQSRYTLISEMDESGSALYVDNISRQQCRLKRLFFPSNQQRQIAFVRASRKLELHHKHLLALKDIFRHTEEGLCSKVHSLYLMHEFPQRTLYQDFSQRALEGRRYREGQLWAIAEGGVQALAYLQRNEVKHESLSLKSIFLDGQGRVRLCDPMFLFSSNNLLKLREAACQKHLYITPTQFQQLKMGINPASGSTYRSDVFTMGMILLELGLLQHLDQLYQSAPFKQEELNARINQFGQNYSRAFKRLLEEMLADEERRVDWLLLEKQGVNQRQATNIAGPAALQAPQQIRPLPVSVPDSIGVVFEGLPSRGLGVNSKPVNTRREEKQTLSKEPSRDMYSQGVQLNGQLHIQYIQSGLAKPWVSTSSNQMQSLRTLPSAQTYKNNFAVALPAAGSDGAQPWPSAPQSLMTLGPPAPLTLPQVRTFKRVL